MLDIIEQPGGTIKQWKTFPTIDIPSLYNEGRIFHYLVEQVNSVNLVGDPVGELENDDVGTAKPLRKGKVLCGSCFVTDIQDFCDTSCYHVRSHVHHSMKNDIPLHVMATLSKLTGFIKKQHAHVK